MLFRFHFMVLGSQNVSSNNPNKMNSSRNREGDLNQIFSSLSPKGLAVAQLCKLVGDVTLFGVASKAKHETLEPLGLITNLLERNGDYLNEVRK